LVFVSSEVAAFARTGGLGDAVDGLARALARLGADVVVVTPRYGVTRVPAGAEFWPEALPAEVGFGPQAVRRVGVLEVRVPVAYAEPGGSLRVCLLDDPSIFQRAGLYGDAFGEFGDNPYRFCVLSRGALSIADRVWGPIHARGGGPDVLHAHDWHAAPSLLYSRLRMGPVWQRLPAVFSIHNLQFQGAVPREGMGSLGLPDEAFRSDLLEHEGRCNLLKGAAAVADRIVTVSRGYAREILEPEQGFGLDGFLRHHAGKLLGIENGIDTEAFDPRTDRCLSARYDAAEAPTQRRKNKEALLSEFALDGGTGPLFAVVSRLAWQKGIDLFLEVIPGLVERGARVVLVGTGDEPLEDAVEAAAARFPGRVGARIAFDGALARRVYGGADFIVVPSRFEPCGLTQLYAMRYGAIPVVTPVGGLRDTVLPLDDEGLEGTGLVAAGVDGGSLRLACEEALEVYGQPARWAALVRRAMARESSWEHAAKSYLALYRELAGQRRWTTPP
jgi:starch synthase